MPIESQEFQFAGWDPSILNPTPTAEKPAGGTTVTQESGFINGQRVYAKFDTGGKPNEPWTWKFIGNFDANGNPITDTSGMTMNANGTNTPATGTSSSTGVAGSASSFPGATSAQENAIELLKRTFASYGLDSLAGDIVNFVKKGYGGDTISLMLQDTPAYKQRFSANEARKKLGLPVLSPAEYLGAEGAYRNVMRQAGLPTGFYDSTEDFSKFIANDISATELQGRLNTAREAISNMDQTYADQLKRYYGMTTGDLVAYALDPNTALPALERKAAAVNFGTAAAQQGVNADLASAEYYTNLGVSADQARQGFTQIAQTAPTYEKLANIYGNMPQDTTKSLMAATFGGEASATEQERIRKLARAEQGTFGGSSGVGQTSLGGGVSAGQL